MLRRFLLLIAAPAATFAADVVIPDTYGKRHGGNLFHAFSEFNIGDGDTTTFTQTQSGTISSVFARVTGNTRSEIKGTLRSTIPGANFYLMNPNGITFGPKATVNIDGSFAVTTADHFTFADGTTLHATAPITSDSVTSAALSSFGFLTNAPRSIEISSTNLAIKPCHAFTAIGGDIHIKKGSKDDNGGSTPDRAAIKAPGGQTILTSVAAKGDVALNGKLTATGPRRRGASGISMDDASIDTSDEQGGGITIRAPKLTLSQSTISSTTKGEGTGVALTLAVPGRIDLRLSSIGTQTSGRGTAGTVKANSGAIHIGSEGFLGSVATNTTEPTAAAGRVSIRAGRLTLTETGRITANTEGAGRAGAVDVAVSRELRMGGNTTIAANTILPHASGRGGRGGNVRVRAGELALLHGASIASSTASDGHGGNVTVAAKTLRIESGARIEANTTGSGSGGNIAGVATHAALNGKSASRGTGIFANNDSPDRQTLGGSIAVRADTLTIRDGSLITSRITGPGRAGDVTIAARDLTIARDGAESFTGIAADSALGKSGIGGNVRVLSERITVAAGGQITSNTAGLGAGGDVSVHARELTLAGGRLPSVIGTESQSFGLGGDGGDVFVGAEELTIRTGGRISASTFGSGAAGDVRVRAGQVFISNGASRQGTGILSESVSPTQPGAGGTVSLDADTLTLADGGRISAATFGPGDGGDVNVTARSAFFSPGTTDLFTGLLAASNSTTAGGKGGTIRAHFGTLSLAGGSISATTAGPGAGGSVFVEAGNITLSDTSTIEAAAARTGAAGSVELTSATAIALSGGSSITVRSALSDAGSIRLIAPQRITLQDSTILAEAGLNGGDVFIDPQFVILDHSLISANAILGAGGNIVLISDTFLASESVITASSEASVQGTIDIQSPDAQLANALTALPSGFLDINIRLSERCPMRLSSELSSFLVIGRGGLPPAPEDLR